MRRSELYARFAPLSALCLVFTTIGFDVLAMVVVGGRSFTDAVSESVGDILAAPFLTFLLIVPFVALTGLTVEVAKTANAKVAAAYYGVFCALLGFVYFGGYWGAQTAMEDRAWTAATLSVPMIAFWSVAVIVVAGLAVALIERKHRRET